MGTQHLVILAAGQGSRMDPLTRTRPKVLLPVAGRVLMEHLLVEGAAAGFRRVSVVVHAGADQVRERLGDGSRFGVELDYVHQDGTGGTGHAVACLDGHVDGDFVVASGDSFLHRADLAALRDASGAAVAGHTVPDTRAYGVLSVQGGRLQGIMEKPPQGGPGLANAGAYRFPSDVVALCRELAPSPRGERELTDAVTRLAQDAKVAVVEAPSWMEAGRPWELLDLQAHMGAGLETAVAGDIASRVDMEGPIVIGEGARIHHGVRLEGPVWIGAGARIGPNAYLRGPVHVGRGCHVGAGVELKNTILGDHSNVPHLSYVGDSVIGSHCNLGAGTQVANLKLNDRNVRVHWQGRDWIDTGRRKLGVVLGDGARTGVNCSLMPGTVLGPGAWGAAGEVVSGWREARPTG